MITVNEADNIIQRHATSYGSEHVRFDLAAGRILAADILADRDLPPYNRATMDGIAIQYAAFAQGRRSFAVKAILAAGDTPVEIANEGECVEIMTGAALPATTDTVIRYEDTRIADGNAIITIDAIKKGQNIHLKGRDKEAGETVIKAPYCIDAAAIGMAASTGSTMLEVKKLPKVVIIATGDELVAADEQPTPYQLRSSNSSTTKAVLQQYCISVDTMHINDDLAATKQHIKTCLDSYDVIILSGGVSMGKFDYVPQALQELQVSQLFHKVAQRPGKPFWFGAHQSSHTLVFAFPGNPVSGFMCLYRYFLPWLHRSLGIATDTGAVALLDADVTFTPPLQYFMQVRLQINGQGQLTATPVEGNGSGDFSNLLEANAFMELPAERANFSRGEVHRVWPFKPIL